MIPQLPQVAVPDWLTELSPTTMTNGRFPIRELLHESLYFPCSAFDGDPVKHLAGNILSFVYVDYGHGRDEFLAELENRGFRGYNLLATRSIAERELAPHGWHPMPPSHNDGDPSLYRDRIQKPFCIWSVFQRKKGCAAGPHRFSLLYLCADGVAAFQALYTTNSVAPRAVAVIQPGHAFGGNWTDLTKPYKIFARNILQDNPGGPPQVLLYGGYGDCESYRRPCWPGYPTNVCFYRRYPYGGSRGCVGIWSRRPRSET